MDVNRASALQLAPSSSSVMTRGSVLASRTLSAKCVIVVSGTATTSTRAVFLALRATTRLRKKWMTMSLSWRWGQFWKHSWWLERFSLFSFPKIKVRVKHGERQMNTNFLAVLWRWLVVVFSVAGLRGVFLPAWWLRASTARSQRLRAAAEKVGNGSDGFYASARRVCGHRFSPVILDEVVDQRYEWQTDENGSTATQHFKRDWKGRKWFWIFSLRCVAQKYENIWMALLQHII